MQITTPVMSNPALDQEGGPERSEVDNSVRIVACARPAMQVGQTPITAYSRVCVNCDAAGLPRAEDSNNTIQPFGMGNETIRSRYRIGCLPR
jgi:hypothetical protein